VRVGCSLSGRLKARQQRSAAAASSGRVRRAARTPGAEGPRETAHLAQAGNDSQVSPPTAGARPQSGKGAAGGGPLTNR
jgi:hypothetical protein